MDCGRRIVVDKVQLTVLARACGFKDRGDHMVRDSLISAPYCGDSLLMLELVSFRSCICIC